MVSLIMQLVRRPTSKTGRYRRWIRIGWKPVLHSGKSTVPVQDKFLLRLQIVQDSGAQLDMWAETGETTEEDHLHRPYMEVSLHLLYDPAAAPQCLRDVAASLHQTCRHEIEHLMDEGFLALPGPGRRVRLARRTHHLEAWQKSVRIEHWINVRRRMFVSGSVTADAWSRLDARLLRESSDPKCRVLSYMVSPRELHAFVMGFYAEARFRGVEWDTPMREYLDSMVCTSRMTPVEAEAAAAMLTQWAEFVVPHAFNVDKTPGLLTMRGAP